MKLSEITLNEVKSRLRIDYDNDDGVLAELMAAATAVIVDRTGRTAEELDEFDQCYHLFMVLIQHMYDNGTLITQSDKLDTAAQLIMNQLMTADVVIA